MLPVTEVFFDHEDSEHVGNYHTKFVNPYGPNQLGNLGQGLYLELDLPDWELRESA